MKKKRFVLLAVALAAFLATGITVLALTVLPANRLA